ncbi:MAG: hypothetical protein U9O94_06445 [Nanoarchaeota archaeon]|nr:hypothetical protein [Nanoarchaeota archaeon]
MKKQLWLAIALQSIFIQGPMIALLLNDAGVNIGYREMLTDLLGIYGLFISPIITIILIKLLIKSK